MAGIQAVIRYLRTRRAGIMDLGTPDGRTPVQPSAGKARGMQDHITGWSRAEFQFQSAGKRRLLDTGASAILSQRQGNQCLPRDLMRREPLDSSVPTPLWGAPLPPSHGGGERDMSGRRRSDAHFDRKSPAHPTVPQHLCCSLLACVGSNPDQFSHWLG